MNRKKLIVIVLAVLMVVSAVKMYSDAASVNAEYKQLLVQAEKYESEGLFQKAVNSYEKALEIKDSPDIYLKIGEIYLTNNQHYAAIDTGETALSLFPYSPEPYDFLSKAYLEMEDYQSLYELFGKMDSSKVDAKEANALREEIKDAYQLGISTYLDVSGFSRDLCAVKFEETWGYIDSAGKSAFKSRLKIANPFTGKYATVNDNETWYIVDTTGLYQKNLSQLFEGCSDVGNINNDLFPLAINGKYSYYSIKDFQKQFGEYDFAGTFCEGVAPVRIGEECYLINTSGERVAGPYTDIRLNELKLATRCERAFISEGSGFCLIDSSGNRIGNTVFQDAKCFNSDGIAAVKLKGKWGFINTDGEIVITPSYSDARSFSNGYAAVQKGNEWMFINVANEAVISGGFKGAMDMGSKGNAMVSDGSNWFLLRLYRYMY